jgi:membrane protease YdiL (CAAX protease family)
MVCAHHLLGAPNYLLTYGVMVLARLPSSGAHTPFLAIPILFVTFFILGTGEELGWMGYAADPMQERRSALTTGIILELVWAIWHFVPLIQMGRTLAWIAWWTLSTVALRILIVWLYSNTGKSVFAAIVFHATSNLSLPAFPMDYDRASVQFTLGTIIAMAAVIVSFLWGSKTLARFRYAGLR